MNQRRAGDLWEAASSWYRRDGVAAACGSLQDDHGVDIPVLLACAWAGAVLLDADPDLVDACVSETDAWHDTVVAPLRRIRRSIAADSSSGDRVRAAVGEAELAAERGQLTRLERLIVDREVTGHHADALVLQLAAVCRRIEIDRRSSRPLLALVGAAIDTGRTPADIEAALDEATGPEAATSGPGSPAHDLVAVRCFQVASPTDEPLDERIERVAALLDDHLERHPTDIAVLPELWTTGFFHFDRYHAEAQAIDGAITERLASIARRHSVWLFGGSFVELAADGRHHNTSVAFGPSGEIVGRYRKVHLFGYESAEAGTLSAGDAPIVVDTPYGRIGMATCYDLRFPELFRAMVDAGAEIFVVVSAWPASRRDHWELLARSRAVENLTWLVACNAAGEQADAALAGTSLVVSPWGEIVERAGVGPQTISASLSLGQLRRIRADFPSLGDRRRLPPAIVQVSAAPNR